MGSMGGFVNWDITANIFKGIFQKLKEKIKLKCFKEWIKKVKMVKKNRDRLSGAGI